MSWAFPTLVAELLAAGLVWIICPVFSIVLWWLSCDNRPGLLWARLLWCQLSWACWLSWREVLPPWDYCRSDNIWAGFLRISAWPTSLWPQFRGSLEASELSGVCSGALCCGGAQLCAVSSPQSCWESSGAAAAVPGARPGWVCRAAQTHCLPWNTPHSTGEPGSLGHLELLHKQEF